MTLKNNVICVVRNKEPPESFHLDLLLTSALTALIHSRELFFFKIKPPKNPSVHLISN